MAEAGPQGLGSDAQALAVDIRWGVDEALAFLSDLDEEETVIARSDERDRSLAIRVLGALPDVTFDAVELY